MCNFVSGPSFLYFSQQGLRVRRPTLVVEVWGCGCVQCQTAALGHARAHGQEGQAGEGCFPAIRLVGLTLSPVSAQTWGFSGGSVSSPGRSYL